MEKQSGFQLKGTGPEAYERYMVPIHCLTRANDLMDRVHLQPRERVLDVACGTGLVSRYAASKVGFLGHVTGVELNPAMLEVARRISACYEQIEYVEGSALDLPVPDSAYDAIFCQQALMFFPDRVRAVREMHRSLKPGGRVALNVWRTPEHNPTFDCLIKALERHAGREAADFMRSPFVMRSVSEMRSIFEQAGFADIRVVIRVDTLRYPSVAHLVRFETLNIPNQEIQSDDMQHALTREMDELVADYVDDEGVVFPLQDYVVVARR